jgi:hypothetical protein
MATKDDLERIKELIKKVFDELVEAKELMDEVSDWDTPEEWLRNTAKVKELMELIASVGNDIQAFLGTVTDEELVELLAEYLDELIKLPIYLEPFDKFAFKMILAYVLNKIRENYPSEDEPSDSNLIEKARAITNKVLKTKDA